MTDFLRGKRILIISPENWGIPHVSKHHYAIELARRNNEVWYCGPQDVNDRTDEGVLTLESPKTPKGLRFLPKRIRRIFNRRIASYFRNVCGGDIDIVWSFDTSRLFDLRCIFPEALRILHIVDLNMEFQWKTAVKQSEICFGVSDIICKRLETRHPRVFKIPHGCDISFISKNTETFEPSSAAYAGNLNIPYLNTHLLAQLIRHYSNVTFHLYGPYKPTAPSNRKATGIGDVLTLPNVKYHGTLPPEQLWSELATKSVLLLCYDQQYRDQIANPHKLMTYLSTGRPILSTTLLEYRWLEGLVCYEDNSGAYIHKFGELIQANETRSEERIRVAREHSYSEILNKISFILESSIND